MIQGSLDLGVIQPLATQVEADPERTMAFGRTGPHRHGTVTIVIDPAIATAMVEYNGDHLLLESLLTQASGQLGFSTFAAGKTAHGKGAGGGDLLFKGQFDGLARLVH